MGTITSGFWKLKFIVTPDEFEKFLQECEKYKITFILPTYEHPQHDLSRVLEYYTKNFYLCQALSVKKEDLRPSFVYSMHIPRMLGFHMANEEIRFPYYREWGCDRINYIMISCQKGVAVPLGSDGKYFAYDDISKHHPEMYPIFEALTNSIKIYTKPLRFTSIVIDKPEEIKPTAVRISQSAAKDFSTSWLFKHYELEMKSYSK
jgi:hypothetical protein